MEAQAISTIQQGVPFYLPVNAGEKITVLSQDENWIYAQNSNGQVILYINVFW